VRQDRPPDVPDATVLLTVYQQAKKTDRNVELAIDEAHLSLEDQANLDFLETAFRHQRHAGLRMVLLSQTAQEFYETDQAEKILGMCPIKVFHKLPDLDDETADKIGLTREQRQYVRGADAGKGGPSATVRHSSVSKNTGPTHCTSLRIRSRSASLTTNQQIRSSSSRPSASSLRNWSTSTRSWRTKRR